MSYLAQFGNHITGKTLINNYTDTFALQLLQGSATNSWIPWGTGTTSVTGTNGLITTNNSGNFFGFYDQFIFNTGGIYSIVFNWVLSTNGTGSGNNNGKIRIITLPSSATEFQNDNVYSPVATYNINGYSISKGYGTGIMGTTVTDSSGYYFFQQTYSHTDQNSGGGFYYNTNSYSTTIHAAATSSILLNYNLDLANIQVSSANVYFTLISQD